VWRRSGEALHEAEDRVLYPDGGIDPQGTCKLATGLADGAWTTPVNESRVAAAMRK